jgi:GNAT superfamily N-acetyltransferase
MDSVVVSFSRGFSRDVLDGVREMIAEEVRRGHVFLLAVVGDEVVGGVSGFRYWQPDHRLWEINHVWIDPSCPTFGAADALMDAMIKYAHEVFQVYGFRGARCIFLHTHDLKRPDPSDRRAVRMYRRNQAAHRFYERHGFSAHPFLADFSRPGVDELTYDRRFPEND